MRFSPSTAHRWIGGGCTGSVKAEAAALKIPSGPQATEGTRLHKLAEGVLKGEIEADDCVPEDWEIIGPYVEDVQKAERAYATKANYEYNIFHPDYGNSYLDAVLFTQGRVTIWDLKTGHRPVEAKGNWQLLLSAVMQRAVSPATTWDLRIVQQPGYHPDGPIRSWTVNDLTLHRVLAEQARKAALSHAPQLHATPSNCLYCKAVTSCPAARNVTLGGMDLAMGGVGPLPAAAIRTELVTLRNTAKLVASRLTSLEAEAEERMRRGESVPGCTMAASRKGALAWSADDDKVRAVCSMVGQSADKVSLRTPSQMIKAGVPEELVATLATRHSPKLSVVTDAVERAAKLFSS